MSEEEKERLRQVIGRAVKKAIAMPDQDQIEKLKEEFRALLKTTPPNKDDQSAARLQKANTGISREGLQSREDRIVIEHMEINLYFSGQQHKLQTP